MRPPPRAPKKPKPRAGFSSTDTSETRTRNIVLTPELDRFITELVNKAGYLNASEVVRESLREMRERQRRRGLYQHRLHLALSHGVIELDAGQSAEVKSDEEFDSYLKRLMFRSLRRARFKATSRAHRFMPRDRRSSVAGSTLPPDDLVDED